MTILTPAQVQEMAELWPVHPGTTHYADCWKDHKNCAIARLIASHRAVVEERDKLADGLSISEGLRKWSMKQLEQSQAEATRLRTALIRLSNEVSGSLGIAGAVIRHAIGNTNYECLEQRTNEARALLQALTGQEVQGDSRP